MSDEEFRSDLKTVEDISSPEVFTKYFTGSEIVNNVLAHIITLCVEGADIYELCTLSDKMLDEKLNSVYNKKENGQKVMKGIAFPTCIALNEICGNYSPFSNESTKIQQGDMVKIDMAIHIDGYVSFIGHTIVVNNGNIEGEAANVLKAAHSAMEAALRCFTPEYKNSDVTKVMNTVASDFGCNMVQGVLSHQMKRHVIDGNQVIISHESSEEKVDEFNFENYQVYCLDVTVSTGDGKPKENDFRTTVYKRAIETNYNIKSPMPRQFLNEVMKRFPIFPFSLRMISDSRIARLGVTECQRHNLLHSYPILCEKKGDLVASFKTTILITPNGVKKITSVPFLQNELCKPSNELKDDFVKSLLQKSLNIKKKKNKTQV